MNTIFQRECSSPAAERYGNRTFEEAFGPKSGIGVLTID
jgi:hypothetical protein